MPSNNSRICLDQTRAISFTQSWFTYQITNRLASRYSMPHQPQQTTASGCAVAYIRGRPGPGGLTWMPALAESATFRTKGHTRVADG